jgi:hypothetical protein
MDAGKTKEATHNNVFQLFRNPDITQRITQDSGRSNNALWTAEGGVNRRIGSLLENLRSNDKHELLADRWRDQADNLIARAQNKAEIFFQKAREAVSALSADQQVELGSIVDRVASALVKIAASTDEQSDYLTREILRALDRNDSVATEQLLIYSTEKVRQLNTVLAEALDAATKELGELLRFEFKEWAEGRYEYKQASGELAVPGEIQTHRDLIAQSELSRDTGEHAGHLIGIQFGAPGDIRNMSLQNPNMNTFTPSPLQKALGPGGSYYRLELEWKNLLKDGYRVSVTVCDKFNVGENRPFARSVEWHVINRQGGVEHRDRREFGNFNSPQKAHANEEFRD